MAPDQTFIRLVKKYKSHPQFIGIEISDPNQKGAMGDTLLHVAVEMGNVEDVEGLVRLGAKVNTGGDIGNTPLHSAALMGHTSAVEKLLDLGADPRIRNDFGETPFDIANQRNNSAISRLLLRSCKSK